MKFPMRRSTAVATTISLLTFLPQGANAGYQGDTTVRLGYASEITVTVGDGFTGYFGDGGPAVDAQLRYPESIAVDAQGKIYIGDYGNNVIRQVETTGTISTLTTGAARSLAVDTSGNLYIALGTEVRRRDSDGNETRFAGTGVGILSIEGSATEVSIDRPTGLVFDGAGNLYFSDMGNHVVRKVDTNGDLSTIAGTLGQNGFDGDGGPATEAKLNEPSGLALDQSGNLYVADQANHRVRKISTDGTISTVAGTGVIGSLGDGGPAISARLNQPRDVAIDSEGNILISDLGNGRIRRIDSQGVICRATPSFDVGDMTFDKDKNLLVVGPSASRVRTIERPNCIDKTISKSVEDNDNLDLAYELILLAGKANPLNQCGADKPRYTLFAPDDDAVQRVLDELGLSMTYFASSPAVANAVISDHLVAGEVDPSLLTSSGDKALVATSGLVFRVRLQNSFVSPVPRLTDYYANGIQILDAHRGCNSWIYVLDGLLGSSVEPVEPAPPPAPTTYVSWNQPATPTSSKYVIFEMTFSTPVAALQPSNFSNIGTQSNCTMSPVAGTPSSQYSNRYFLVVTCQGSGTVTPRLNLEQTTSPLGTVNVSGSRTGPVIDIVAGKVLTVTKSGTGSGTVASTISAIDCGILCTGVFDTGTTVTLQATPALGSFFVGWSGACQGTGSCTIRMTDVRNVNAEFQAGAAVVVTKIGSGTGTVTTRAGAGSSRRATASATCSTSTLESCVTWYRDGTTVQIVATPSRGFRFVGWMGACSSTGACQVTVRYPDAVHVFPIFERS